MRRSHLASLKDSGTLLEFVGNLKEGVYITTPDGRIVDSNPAFLEMLGVSSLRELRKFSAETLIVEPGRRARELEILSRDGAVREFELELRRPDGEVRTVLDTAYQVTDPDTGERFYHGILVDITQRKRLEAQLREAAIRDALTGCFNRRFLSDIGRKLQDDSALWGAVVVDVDHFKAYNDRFGHDMGDAILVRLARFLMHQVRAEDAVIRMGGDEFLLLITGGAASSTGDVATRLRENAATSAPVSFTLGWAVREAGESVEETIRRADRQLILIRVQERQHTPSRTG